MKGRWEKDLGQVQVNRKYAGQHNSTWKQPKHCAGKDGNKKIKVGGNFEKQYPHKSTDCKPCTALVTKYNQWVDEIRKLAKEIAKLEADIRKIADTPAPKGMSLGDEIKDKQNKTRPLRRALEDAKKTLRAKEQDLNDLGAPSPIVKSIAKKWTKKVARALKSEAVKVPLAVTLSRNGLTPKAHANTVLQQ